MRPIFLILFSVMLAPSLFAATLLGYRINVSNTYQVVFDQSGPINYSSFALKNPDRYVVDFPNTTQKLNISTSIFTGTPIQDMRVAKKQDHTVRVVFDLRTPCKVTTTSMKPSGKRGYRTVVNFTPLQKSKDLVPLKSNTTPPAPVKKKLKNFATSSLS